MWRVALGADGPGGLGRPAAGDGGPPGGCYQAGCSGTGGRGGVVSWAGMELVAGGGYAMPTSRVR